MTSEWQFLAPAVALVWAGVALGGSLIAAPAKFRAPSLSKSTALEVGRAQFFWVGIGEGVLCVLLLGSLFAVTQPDWRFLLPPVSLFLIQRFVLMPALDARTRRVIAGDTVRKSPVHVVCIGLEVGKFVALLIAGAWGLMATLPDAV